MKKLIMLICGGIKCSLRKTLSSEFVFITCPSRAFIFIRCFISLSWKNITFNSEQIFSDLIYAFSVRLGGNSLEVLMPAFDVRYLYSVLQPPPKNFAHISPSHCCASKRHNDEQSYETNELRNKALNTAINDSSNSILSLGASVSCSRSSNLFSVDTPGQSFGNVSTIGMSIALTMLCLRPDIR